MYTIYVQWDGGKCEPNHDSKKSKLKCKWNEEEYPEEKRLWTNGVYSWLKEQGRESGKEKFDRLRNPERKRKEIYLCRGREREGEDKREKGDCQVALSWSKICVALPQF